MDRRHHTRLLLALAVGAAGCRSGSVTIEPRLEVGDRARYRYEIEATVTRALEGADPTTTSLATTLVADQRVLAVGDDGAEAEVALRRDGSVPRTTRVLLDRSGALRGIELAAGLGGGGLALGELGSLLPPSTAPPRLELSPGARWRISEGSLRGHGRLERLGVIDGEHVAVVETDVVETLQDAVAAGANAALLDGELRSTATAAYDLADGAIRRSSARARGSVRASIEPPIGVIAEPIDATIRYDIRVRVTRLD